jgi:outer membrane protein TolC
MRKVTMIRCAGVFAIVAAIAAPLSGADTAPAAPVPPPAPEAISLNVRGAILLSLTNNRDLRVQVMNPDIRRTAEDEERAAFDPVLRARGDKGKSYAEQFARFGPGFEDARVNDFNLGLSAENYFPTGTRLALEAKSNSVDSSLYTDPLVSTRVGGTLVQSLLRGFGLDANLAALRQARVDTEISQYELRGFAELLISQVEQTYWDFTLAREKLRIFETSVKVAEQQLSETNEKIAVGRVPEIERAAAQAEVAQRKQELIEARSWVAKLRVRLLQLLHPGQDASFWSKDIVLGDLPVSPKEELANVEEHARVAMEMRPEIKQAQLELKRATLQTDRTANGVLPRLDFFITLGTTGYATSFGTSLGKQDGKFYDARAGLEFEFPPINRAARAQRQRSLFNEVQAGRAIERMMDLVQAEVRTAYVEVQRAREQVAASIITRQLRELTFQAEQEKFGTGKSTSFLVAQAHRDLISSQISEVESVVNHLKAIVELFRLEGSLLQRRAIGIDSEGPAGFLTEARE